MKFLILVFLFSSSALADEVVSFQTALYGLICTSDGCQMTKPEVKTVNVVLEGDQGDPRPIGFYEQWDEAENYEMGGHILVSRRNDLYMFLLTSWIQEKGKPETRLESHVSVTTDDLSRMSRVNLPSPDLAAGDHLGHAQFMIGSRL